MAIFMQFEGIKGNVSAKDHDKWIELSSCSFSASRGIGSPTGRSADRKASVPSITELLITKECDESSALLFQAALVGEGKKVVIHYVRTSDSVLEVFLEVTISNALVSHFSTNSTGENPSESISLNFTKIEYKFTPFTPDHRPGTPTPTNFDFANIPGK